MPGGSLRPGGRYHILYHLDQVFVAIFTVEITLRVLAYGWRYFKDPWNVFDFLVTAPSWIPGAGTFSVARVARIIRLLRLLSVMDSFKHLTTAMIRSLRDAVGILGIIVILLFVFGAMAYRLFGHMSPELYGTIETSMFTMFKIFALGDLQTTLTAVGDKSAIAYPFFICFYVLMTYIILNFFAAVAATRAVWVLSLSDVRC